jgi:hypothetical protein
MDAVAYNLKITSAGTGSMKAIIFGPDGGHLGQVIVQLDAKSHNVNYEYYSG